jgi:CcmD family protein
MNRLAYISLIVFLLTNLSVFAQEITAQPEMADVFRSEGKIYTVVAVFGIVLIGMFVYLFLTERKLSKLEKQLKAKE